MFLSIRINFFFYFITFIDSIETITSNCYLSIFIITHKDFQPFVSNNFYKIITDNVNSLELNYSLDIIYSKYNNPFYPKKIAYGESSKMYYIWKNYKHLPKYIGFNHYRRYFEFGNNIPNLDDIFKNYDVILSKAENLNYSVIMQQFKDCHFGHALEEVIEIIKEIKPEYYDAAVKTMNSSIAYWGNMFIMKSGDFLKWGEFLFPIMLEYDKKHKLNNDLDVKNYILREWEKYETKELNVEYQRRLEGFVVERLSNIFYNYQFKNKYEVNTVQYDMIPAEIKAIIFQKKLKRKLKNTVKKSFINFSFFCTSLFILYILFCQIRTLSKYMKKNKNKFEKIKIKEINNLNDMNSNNDYESLRIKRENCNY